MSDVRRPDGALRFADGVAVALVSPGAGLTALPASIGELRLRRYRNTS